jgi:hypothetical protein
VNLWLESILKCTPEICQNFCRYCEELISEDWTKLMVNLSFENVLPLIISFGESDSDLIGILMQVMMIQNFLKKLWKLNSFVLFCRHGRWVCKYFAERFE